MVNCSPIRSRRLTAAPADERPLKCQRASILELLPTLTILNPPSTPPRYDGVFPPQERIMGLLDQVVGGLAANALGGKGNGLAEMAMQLVNQYPGGLGGLVQAFRQGGLGEIVDSWVSTGQNLPVSGDQLSSVLGSDLLGTLAGQAGVAPQELSSGLAALLPGLVDQLTPGGKLPEGGDLLAQGLDMLKKGGLFG